MNIANMHVWFRQYAQQMGMQNIRAILPEQIDLLINTSITDVINQIIRENIGITNDRVITDNSKIGQINALRNLYNVKLIDLAPNNANDVNFCFQAKDRKIGRISTWGPGGSTKAIPDYLFLVDFSINYREVSNNNGYSFKQTFNEFLEPIFEKDSIETNYFPVRLIDDAFLADTLNDFILKNRLRSPIMVNYNGQFDIYIDEFKEVISKTDSSKRYLLDNNLLPYKLRMSYIAKPAEVRYAEDIGGTNVDCDLPDYLHIDILKHAVDLYRIAINGSLHSSQQQEQAAQQENVRNNYRNEGTNSRQ